MLVHVLVSIKKCDIEKILNLNTSTYMKQHFCSSFAHCSFCSNNIFSHDTTSSSIILHILYSLCVCEGTW